MDTQDFCILCQEAFASCCMICTGLVVILFLLKSITISFVLVTLRSRCFLPFYSSCLPGPNTPIPVHLWCPQSPLSHEWISAGASTWIMGKCVHKLMICCNFGLPASQDQKMWDSSSGCHNNIIDLCITNRTSPVCWMSSRKKWMLNLVRAMSSDLCEC